MMPLGVPMNPHMASIHGVRCNLSIFLANQMIDSSRALRITSLLSVFRILLYPGMILLTEGHKG